MRQDSYDRDIKLNSVISGDPSAIYKSIKSHKSSSSQIQSIRVGGNTYRGDCVPDGFYDSMSRLKCPDMSAIKSSPQFQSTLADYENIIKICKSRQPIPSISPTLSLEILKSVKADVNDFYSITANHFIHAGQAGISHFHLLLSTIISNVNLAGLDELNTAWSCIQYKGHSKDKESDRSYRNISTCPFLAKCADLYVGKLYKSGWAACQAETQFQGEGSSHELAALLFTETIQHSLSVNFKPVYALFLDAMSAYDKIVRQCAIRSAFLAGNCPDQGILYLNARLENRRTFPEWNKVLMGPIHDFLGLEQGNVNSDRLYKLCNNNQLSTAQLSQLGISCGPVVVSCVGQADDTIILSDCIYKLSCLVNLAEEYCSNYHVTLVPEKTKLLVFSSPAHTHSVNLAKIVNPITVSGKPICFTETAEHVGILRSDTAGNMPHILGRIAAHRRAVQGILHCGLAKGHRGNPAAGLRLERSYGAPVLLSGVAALVLSSGEMSALHQHYKSCLRQILRLPVTVPESFVMFVAGSLPATAIVHLKTLTLLGMIARLGRSGILDRLGRHSLLTAQNKGSWFLAVRRTTQKYSLPDPLLVLQQPLPKGRWKSLCRSKVISWWETHYRGEADALLSLAYFNPNFFSLTKSHNILLTAKSPYENKRASTVLLMLSGRYVSDFRTRKFDNSNQTGACRLCPSSPGSPAPAGTLEHQLLQCPTLQVAYRRAADLWSEHLAARPWLQPAVAQHCHGSLQSMVQFLLNPSSCHAVISAAQELGQDVYTSCHYLARVWVHGTHTLRIKMLKTLGHL